MRINQANLGTVIKTIRKQLHISQKELAKRTGLSANYLCLLENGRRGIRIDTLNSMAEIFQLPAEILTILAAEPDSANDTDSDVSQLRRELQDLAQSAVDLHISLRPTT